MSRLKSIKKKFANFVSESQTSRNRTKRLTWHICSQHGALYKVQVIFETKMLRKENMSLKKKKFGVVLFNGSVSQPVLF